MGKTIFLLVFMALLSANSAFAQFPEYINAKQDTTTLFSSPAYASDPLRANWTRKVETKDGLWVLSMYDQKQELREKVSFADEQLHVRQGPYAFYENGNLIQKGSYDKGYKYGEWKTYYANKKIEKIVNYAWDKLFGPYQTFWDNGTLKREGIYGKGEESIGTWKLYYKTGKLAYEEVYNEAGKLEGGKYFDEVGKEVTYKSLVQEPSYPGGLEAFYKQLNNTIKYPKSAFKNNIQGVVKLIFTVKKDGRITDISVKESPDPELGREAIRVLMKSKPWLPGKEIGEPVSVRYTLPITFSISN